MSDSMAGDWRAAFPWIPSPVSLAATGKMLLTPHFLLLRCLYPLRESLASGSQVRKAPSEGWGMLLEICPFSDLREEANSDFVRLESCAI